MPKPHNVVIVSDDASYSGGAAAVAIDSARQLAGAGKKVIFFAGKGPVDPHLASAPIEVHLLDVPSYTERGIGGLISGLSDPHASKAFGGIIERLPTFDTLIHFHSYISTLSSSVPAAAQKLGFAIAFTLHEYNFGCPYGGFFDYRRGRMCGKRGLSLGCLTTNCTKTSYTRKLWRYGRLLHQKQAARVPHRGASFLLLSDLNRRVLTPYLPAKAKLYHVPNGIEVERKPRVEVERNSSFLFVGRLTAEKGPHLFVEAAERAGVPYTVAGDGDARDALQAAGPSGRFLGWQNRDSVYREMAQARALVFPSLWFEGQPLTVLEAQAAGLPVIASSNTAAAEMLIDGESGLIFEYGSVGNLGETMSALQDDPLVKRLSEGAYQRFWADPPTTEKHLQRLLEVYEEIMEGR